MSTASHYLNGQWVDGAGLPLVVVDPASGRISWRGTAANADEVALACRSARTAFDAWAGAALPVRLAVCERFASLVDMHAEELARTISGEVGKPLWEAHTEVASIAAKVRISIQAHAERTGESSQPHPDGISILRHRPHGVLAVFGPYNFPGHLPNGHVVPALLAGNTLVFKPSEHAPRTAIATVRLWYTAGLPAGVLNLVNGGQDTGALLAAQPALDGILFTGSHRTGALLHRQYAGQPGKMLALEMGGNNPLVVWQAADLDAAVHHTILSAYLSAGQRCTCARRIIVEDGPQGRAFIERLVAVAARLRVGAGCDEPAPFMGPVVSNAAARNLLAVQDDLISRGATVLLPMRLLQPDTGLLSAGIIDITDAGEVPDEEWFGPLAQIIRVPDFASAVAAANNTAYGLAASLLSDNPDLWREFSRKAHAGIVNWNRPSTGAASNAPFGGIGKSGNHRPSAYYAADYCAYPVASIESRVLQMPAQLLPSLCFDRDADGSHDG